MIWRSILAISLLLHGMMGQTLVGPSRLAGPMKLPSVTSGGGATPAFVQSNVTSGAVVGSTGLAFLSNVVIGNIVVAYMFDGNGSGDAIAFNDTGTNSYSTPSTGAKTLVSLTTDGDTTAVACAVIGASGALTVKWTINASAVFGARVALYEISGATCTQETSNTGHTLGSSPCSSGAVTTLFTNDLLIGTCGTDTQNTYTAGSGWSHLAAVAGASDKFGSMEFQVGTTITSYTATTTYSTSTENCAIIVEYKHQ